MFLLVGENILINAVKYNKNPLTEISIEISRVEKKNVKYYKLEFKDNIYCDLHKYGQLGSYKKSAEISTRGV